MRLTGISLFPFGLPTKGAIEKRGAPRFGSPVAVFSSHSDTLGNVAGSGGSPICALNVNEGNVTLLMVYGGANGGSNRCARSDLWD